MVHRRGIEPIRDWPQSPSPKTNAQFLDYLTNNSSFQNYSHPDDHTIRTTDTPGFKLFTMCLLSRFVFSAPVIRPLATYIERDIRIVVLKRHPQKLASLKLPTVLKGVFNFIKYRAFFAFKNRSKWNLSEVDISAIPPKIHKRSEVFIWLCGGFSSILLALVQSDQSERAIFILLLVGTLCMETCSLDRWRKSAQVRMIVGSADENVCRLCRLVTKFEMAEANVLKTFLAARKVLHFIKFTPPFSTVGSFSEVRFRGSHYEASSNATPQDVSKKLNSYILLFWSFLLCTE